MVISVLEIVVSETLEQLGKVAVERIVERLGLLEK